MRTLTSETHPLRIDSVDLAAAEGGGRIGMTICPGKQDPVAQSGPALRELDRDLDVIRDWGATAFVCLLEAHELELLKVPDLQAGVQGRGMSWWHLPIRDVDIPDERFEQSWPTAGADLRRRLRSGESILVHCRGGLGRTGIVASRLLVDLGEPPVRALERVRAARPYTVENPEQERYVLGLAAKRLPS